jgi:myo-inositol-hexaphosphate 3-phosphohydrolase
MNNVDVRDDFQLGEATVSLVTASNRSTDSISIYRVDPATRRLVDVADGVQDTGLLDPYGLCMYRSAASGRHYVFINDGGGEMRQWELVDNGGRVRANLVREFAFDSQPEGCVADDETGVLYVAEEDVGLWRMGAEPDAGYARTSIATVESNEALQLRLRDLEVLDDFIERVELAALAHCSLPPMAPGLVFGTPTILAPSGRCGPSPIRRKPASHVGDPLPPPRSSLE